MNAIKLRNQDPDTYNKIKFNSAIDYLNEATEIVQIPVKDNFGRKKVKEVDKTANVTNAAKIHGHLAKERASDMFMNFQNKGSNPNHV